MSDNSLVALFIIALFVAVAFSLVVEILKFAALVKWVLS